MLLSVNDNDVTGLTNTQLENILKSLPKGSVTITAMSPTRDVIGQRPLQTPSTNNDDEGIINVKVCYYTCMYMNNHYIFIYSVNKKS